MHEVMICILHVDIACGHMLHLEVARGRMHMGSHASYHQHMLTDNPCRTVLQQYCKHCHSCTVMVTWRHQDALLMHFCPYMIPMHAE